MPDPSQSSPQRWWRRPGAATPGDLVGWIPPALVIAVTIGMVLASPVWASPDAPMQQITAWFDVHHLVPSASTLVELKGPIIPCFAHHADLAGSCTISHPVSFPQTFHIATLNYPPLAYWIMGTGQLIGSLAGGSWVSTGGRLIAMIACLVAVVIASRVLINARQRSALWMLPIAMTPMATFLFTGSNANGLEIALAALFVALLHSWRQSLDDAHRTNRSEILLGLSALGFAACKPGDGIWIVLLAVAAAVRWRSCLTVPVVVRLVAACTPAIVVSIAWSLFRPTVITLRGVNGFNHYAMISWLARIHQTLAHLPDTMLQAWGVLGWLDTSPGRPFFLLLGLGTAYYLVRTMTTVGDWAFLLGSIVTVLAIAAAADVATWTSWPLWWQGRYSLPLIVGLALLLVDDRTHTPRSGMAAWAGFASIASAAMVLLVDLRFAAGLRGAFIPIGFAPLIHDPVRTSAVVFIVLALLTSGLCLMFVDRRRSRSSTEVNTSGDR